MYCVGGHTLVSVLFVAVLITLILLKFIYALTNMHPCASIRLVAKPYSWDDKSIGFFFIGINSGYLPTLTGGFHGIEDFPSYGNPREYSN